jgi:hypothetical protein
MFYHECIQLTPTLHSPLCNVRQFTWSKKPQVLSWSGVAILPASFLMLTLQLCPAKTRITNKYCQTLPAADGQRSSFIHWGSSLHVTSSVKLYISIQIWFVLSLYFLPCGDDYFVAWVTEWTSSHQHTMQDWMVWGGWETYFHSITVPELTMVVSCWLAIY